MNNNTDLLHEAAERYRFRRDTPHLGPAPVTIYSHRETDLRILADAYLAHLSAQRAAEEDGAKPIDQEFLQTLGFVHEHHDCGDGYATFCTRGELSIWKSASGRWVMKDAAWIELITRAQLTALLVALNTKGTA